MAVRVIRSNVCGSSVVRSMPTLVSFDSSFNDILSSNDKVTKWRPLYFGPFISIQGLGVGLRVINLSSFTIKNDTRSSSLDDDHRVQFCGERRYGSKIAFAIGASHKYRPHLAEPLLGSIPSVMTVPDSMLGTEYHWSASSRHRRATPKE